VLSLLMATTASGADKAPQRTNPTKKELKLTLERAIRMALDTNLRVTDAQLSVADSEYQRQAAYSDFFPNLEILYSATIDRYQDPARVFQFARSQDSRRGFLTLFPDLPFFPVFTTYPYRIDPYRYFKLTATVTQPLYLAGRTVSQYKNAQLQVEADLIQLSLTRQDLILDVTTAYYNIIRYQRLLDVNNQSLASLQKIRKRAWDFFMSKVFSKADYLATDSQIYEVRRSGNTLKTSLLDAQEQLNYLLRVPLGTMVLVQDDAEYKPAPYNLDNIFTIAASNRLELVKAGIAADQARALAKSAKADLLPSAYVQVRGSRVNDDWNVADPEGVNEWAIEGVLRWRFDMFRLLGTVKSRQTEVAQAEVARVKLAEDIMRNVLKAYRALKRAEQDILINRDAAKSNKERFRVVIERYDGQLANYTEALNAQSALYQSLLVYNDALMEYKINLAALEREMGVLGSRGPLPR
jgi:outer membrane protein TolC